MTTRSNPTEGFSSLREFRNANPGVTTSQAEAVWEYFRHQPSKSVAPPLIDTKTKWMEEQRCLRPDVSQELLEKAWLQRSRYGVPLSLKEEVLLLAKVPEFFVVIVGFFLFLMALLFPPFYLQIQDGMSINLGYSWFLQPPVRAQYLARIDVPLLFVELLGIGSLTFISNYLAKQISISRAAR